LTLKVIATVRYEKMNDKKHTRRLMKANGARTVMTAAMFPNRFWSNRKLPHTHAPLHCPIRKLLGQGQIFQGIFLIKKT